MTMETVEPLSFVVAMAILVAIWLVIGIRSLRRARRLDALDAAERLRRATFEREHFLGICAHVWSPDPRSPLVVCSRPYEHTGPHYNQHRDAWDR